MSIETGSDKIACDIGDFYAMRRRHSRWKQEWRQTYGLFFAFIVGKGFELLFQHRQDDELTFFVKGDIG